MMHMTLYWGKDVTLLFDTWTTDSVTSYALSLLACFLFASLYQYLEDLRVRFRSTSASASSYSVNAPLLGSRKRPAGGWRRAGSAVLFGVNAGIGYLLMLVVMSFNGGVLLSVVGGLSVGYFFFRDRVNDDEDQVVAVAENPCGCV